MNLRTIIREGTADLETGGPTNAKKLAASLRDALAERGLTAPCHRSDQIAVNLTPEETLEWYAGEFVDIVEREAWFAVNSWLNAVDKYAPEVT